MNSDTDPSSLSMRTLSAVREAVDHDFVTFDSFGDSGLYLDTQWNSDNSILTDELQSEFERLFNAKPHEHPLAHLLTEPPFQVQRFSDCVAQRDFESTALYNEFFRRIDIHYQTAFLITTDTGAKITCAVNRLKPDFSKREILLLSLLAPQLAASIRTAVELRKLYNRQAAYETALVRSKRALVNVTRNGRITYASKAGEKLIEKYFGAQLLAKTVPKELFDWVSTVFARRDSRAAEITPLYYRSGFSELRIEAIICEEPDELSLLFREQKVEEPAKLQRFGLTTRESEILYWVAMGKTDEVIAILCDISVRTVNKHLEHIYRKLGVESRLAAIQLIRELLNPS